MTTIRHPLRGLVTLALLCCGGPAADLAAQESPPAPPGSVVLGRDASVRVLAGDPLEGELLAVAVDSLWLLTGAGVRSVPLPSVRFVRVRRHGLDGGRLMLWNVLGWAGTSLALTLACTQVSDGCAAIWPTTGLSWALIGGLSGALVARSSRHDLPASEEALRPYARFPQGLPPGFGPGPAAAGFEPSGGVPPDPAAAHPPVRPGPWRLTGGGGSPR